MLRRTPSRVGRGRRAVVDFVVCFGCGEFFRGVGESLFFFFQHTRPAASMRRPCLIYLSSSNEARPRERSDRGRFFPIGKKASSYWGAYRVTLFNLSVGMCVCVCVTFVVFTDCESCARPISTNPGSMESGVWANAWDVIHHMSSRVARGGRAAVDSLCVLGGADFSVILFFDFFFLRTHTACCKYEATLPHLHLY